MINKAERYIDDEEMISDIVSEWNFPKYFNNDITEESKFYLRILFTSIIQKYTKNSFIEAMLYYQLKYDYIAKASDISDLQVIECALLFIQVEYPFNPEKALIELSKLYNFHIPRYKLKLLSPLYWISAIAKHSSSIKNQDRDISISQALSFLSKIQSDIYNSHYFSIQV
jgi:hypothetical protein